MNAPSLKAITEFAVETDNFKAEYGRAGGGLITFVSKSGTDEYHGTAFDFIRNNAFDARGFFHCHGADLQTARFRRHRGRPGSQPENLQRKDNDLLLFLRGFSQPAWARLPARSPFRSRVLRRRHAQRRELDEEPDGTYIPYIVYDPATTTYDPVGKSYTRQPFANNMIPQSRFDPLSQKIP